MPRPTLAAAPAPAHRRTRPGRHAVDRAQLDRGAQDRSGAGGPTRIWIHGGDKGAEALRRDEGDTSYILRLDRGKLYVINHADRTYSELSLPIDPAEDPGRGRGAGQGAGDVDRRDQEDRDLERPQVPGGHLEPGGPASRHHHLGEQGDRLLPRRSPGSPPASPPCSPAPADWARKLEQIDGFPVAQEANVTMGASHFKTREELVSVETKDAPAGAYEPPAGYTAQPWGGAPQ